MKFTPTQEQLDIIATDEDLKVNAVAGSGKTSTLLLYAKNRDFGKTLLYLVFNKSAKEDAEFKFKKAGLRNVVVQTAHSLAYRKIMSLPIYSLNSSGYNSHATMINLNISGSDRYTTSQHVCKYMAAFCNSDVDNINELDYMQCVGGSNEEMNFVKRHLGLINNKAELYWEMMDTAKIQVTHEFYLKKYHLSRPQLKYDYILFDEGQDASPVMLDIFLNQDCKKIIVGDSHQQIYSWRGAVNSLDMVDFKSLSLTKSFRFGSEIAEMAKNIIREKDMEIEIEGVAKYKNNTINSEATISRTNITLLHYMISFIKERPDDPIFFEGNLNSLIYTEMGVSVYDVIHLFHDYRKGIKSPFIKAFSNFGALERYTKQANDREIGTMVTLTKEYGQNLSHILEEIKSKCVLDRDDAIMAFSTAHKSKGLEYDRVTLTEDFAAVDPEDPMKDEEVNILYVAITRAKKVVVLPEDLESYRPGNDQKEKVA